MGRSDQPGFVPKNQLRPQQEARIAQMRAAGEPVRTGLSGAENAVHLILTVFTLGLWGIIWAIRLRATRDQLR